MFAYSDQEPDAAGACEFDGIAKQVEEYLPESAAVFPNECWHCRVDFGVETHALCPGLSSQGVDGAIDQLTEVEVMLFQLHFAGFDLGKVQGFVDQMQQRGAGLLRRPDPGELFICHILLFAQQAEKTEQGIQRGADFVAHAGKKAGFCLGGGLGRFLGLFQCVFILDAFGNVAHVGDEQFAVVYVDSSDRKLHRELLATGAHCRHLDALVHNRAVTGFQVMRHAFPVHLTQPGRDDHIHHRFADNIFPAISECCFGRIIELDDAAILIHGDDAVEGGSQNGMLLFLVQFQFPGHVVECLCCLCQFVAAQDVDLVSDVAVGNLVGGLCQAVQLACQVGAERQRKQCNQCHLEQRDSTGILYGRADGVLYMPGCKPDLDAAVVRVALGDVDRAVEHAIVNFLVAEVFTERQVLVGTVAGLCQHEAATVQYAYIVEFWCLDRLDHEVFQGGEVGRQDPVS